MIETPFVVSVIGWFNDDWEVVAEFHFDTLDDAFIFFDFEASSLIPVAYGHLKGISLFEIAIWDDTFDNGEPLEVMSVEPLANKEHAQR